MAVAITTDLGGISNFDIDVILQLLEHDGKNGIDHSIYSLLEKEYKTLRKRNLFFFTVEDHKRKMCTIRFRKLENLAKVKLLYTEAMKELDQYFTPQVKAPYERHLFRTIAQLPTESADQFITRLRERAEYCEFGNARDENICDQVIEKCMSSRLRRELLEKGRELTLEQLQNTARSMEASDRQAGAIKNPNDKEGLKEGLNSVQEKTDGKICYRCQMTGHSQDDKRCPGRDKECQKCHKEGHFSRCCKTKKAKDPNDKKPRRKNPRGPRDTKPSVNQINSEDSPDSEYVFNYHC